MALVLNSATLREVLSDPLDLDSPHVTVVDYVFDVTGTPPPTSTVPVVNNAIEPLIGQYTESAVQDKIADRMNGVSTIATYDGSQVTVRMTYNGEFDSSHTVDIIGGGNIKAPVLDTDANKNTHGWITLGSEKNDNIYREGPLQSVAKSSLNTKAAFHAATVGENTNPPSMGEDYWEVEFTFTGADGKTPIERIEFRPQFKSTGRGAQAGKGETRRLFIKSVDTIQPIANGVAIVSGRLNRPILSSEVVEISVPSGYLVTPQTVPATARMVSARVYGQAATNNSSVLQLGTTPEVTLRTFPDDLEASTTLYGPVCVGLMIDPEQSDPGADALWSRCVVKHTIEAGSHPTMQSGPDNMPERYTKTIDPRDGYEDAVDGTSLHGSHIRDWRDDGKGFAHCIAATHGTYKWTVEVTNEFGKTKTKTIHFNIQERDSNDVLYVDSNASGSTEQGTQANPFLSIFDTIPKSNMPLDDNYVIELAEGHVESFGKDQKWSTAGKKNVWVRRANMSGPDSTQPRFLQTVDSANFMFNFGANDDGVLVEGIRLVPTTDRTRLHAQPYNPEKQDPGIGFASALRTAADRTAFIDCVVEGEIDQRAPKKILIPPGHDDFDEINPENNFFDNDRFNVGFQFNKANALSGSLLLSKSVQATWGYSISWAGNSFHSGAVVLGGYYGLSSNESCLRTTHPYGLCGLTVDSSHMQDDTSKSAIRIYGGVSITWPSVMGFVGRCQLQDGDTWIGAVNGSMTTDVRVWANRLVGGNTRSGTQAKLKCQWNCSESTFVSNILDIDHADSRGIETKKDASDFDLGRFSPNPNGNNLIAHNTLIDVVVPKAAIYIGAQIDRPAGYLGNLWLNNLHSSLAARNVVYLHVNSAHNIERFDNNVFVIETDLSHSQNKPVQLLNEITENLYGTTVDNQSDGLNTKSWATGNLALGISVIKPDPTTLFPDSANGAVDVAPINGVHFDYYEQPVERAGGSDVIAGAVVSEPS